MRKRRKMKQSVTRLLRITKAEVTFYNSGTKQEETISMELPDYLSDTEVKERLISAGMVPVRLRVLEQYEKFYWMPAEDFIKYGRQQQSVIKHDQDNKSESEEEK